MKHIFIFLTFFSFASSAQTESTRSTFSSHIGIHVGIRPFYHNSDHDTSPLYSATFEQGFTERIGVRAFMAYGRLSYGGSDYDAYLSFGASCIYYPYVRDKVKLYLRGGVGFSREIKYWWFPPKPILRGGIRYFFNENLGAYSDIGLGMSVLNLGLSYTF